MTGLQWPGLFTVRSDVTQPNVAPGLVHGATGRTVQVRRPQGAALHEVIGAKRRGVNNPGYGGVSLAHDLAMRLELDRDINRSVRLLKINVPYLEI